MVDMAKNPSNLADSCMVKTHALDFESTASAVSPPRHSLRNSSTSRNSKQAAKKKRSRKRTRNSKPPVAQQLPRSGEELQSDLADKGGAPLISAQRFELICLFLAGVSLILMLLFAHAFYG